MCICLSYTKYQQAKVIQEKLIRYAPYFNPWSSIDIENDPGYESFNDIELFLSDNNKKISFVVLVQKNSNTN